MLRTIWQKRDLLFSLTKRDLKTRYKSSVLGLFWSVGKPLFLSLIIMFVFNIFVKLKAPAPYSLFVLLGVLNWTFFAGALQDSLNSIIGNSNLIKKIRIQSEVLPVSSLLSSTIHFIIALFLFHAIFICYGNLPHWEIIFLPFVVLIQIIFITGIALIISSMNVFYRDVGSITEVVTSAWFYLTPIIYPVSLAQTEFIKRATSSMDFTSGGAQALFSIYYLNPMTPIILAYRRILLYPAYPGATEIPDSSLIFWLGYSLIASLLLYFIGIYTFRKLSPGFSDEL